MKNDHLLNIVDGTPVHTGWLKRIFTATSTQIVAAVGVASYAFNTAAHHLDILSNASDYNVTIACATPLAAALTYLPGCIDLIMEPSLKKKVFNSNPSASDTIAPENQYLGLIIADRAAFRNYTMAGIMVGYSLIKHDPYASIAVHVPLVLSHCLQGYRFNKVVRGEWSFDDTPPKPKKVPQASLRERWKALKDMAKFPDFRPAPVPAPTTMMVISEHDRS